MVCALAGFRPRPPSPCRTHSCPPRPLTCPRAAACSDPLVGPTAAPPGAGLAFTGSPSTQSEKREVDHLQNHLISFGDPSFEIIKMLKFNQHASLTKSCRCCKRPLTFSPPNSGWCSTYTPLRLGGSLSQGGKSHPWRPLPPLLAGTCSPLLPGVEGRKQNSTDQRQLRPVLRSSGMLF